MGTKIRIEGAEKEIELPRGASIPKVNDIVYVTLKGENEEKVYYVDLVEHVFDLNLIVPFGVSTITLKEAKAPKEE